MHSLGKHEVFMPSSSFFTQEFLKNVSMNRTQLQHAEPQKYFIQLRNTNYTTSAFALHNKAG